MLVFSFVTVTLMAICVGLGWSLYKQNKDIEVMHEDYIEDFKRLKAEMAKMKNKSIENSRKYASSLYMASKPCQPLTKVANQNREVNSKAEYYFFSLYDPKKSNDKGRTTQVAPLLFTKKEVLAAAERCKKNQDDLASTQNKYDLSFVSVTDFI